jgi:hypothetical protein
MSYIWKAIDFGGAGVASNVYDFYNRAYTPHYSPLFRVEKYLKTHRDVAWVTDIIALAHVMRNTVGYMTSTTQKPVPYASVDNMERFFNTNPEKRE